nr:MAG: hypothetical protein [Lokiarchaeota virus Skoll Meg22_1214]
MIYNLINHNKKIIAGLTPLNKKIIVEILDENYFPVKVSIPLYKMEGSKEEVYLFGDVLKTLKECEENKEKEGMK